MVNNLIKPFIASPPSRQAGTDQIHVWSVRQFRDIERVLKMYAQEIENNRIAIAAQDNDDLV